MIPRFPKTSFKFGSIRLTLTAPFGLASGWADTPRKVYDVLSLGAGLVFTKTVTFHPKYGNPYPRMVRGPGNNWLINSMGLPNAGLACWLQWLRHHGRLPENAFFSIKGENPREWRVLIKALMGYTSLIELNFSCPNVEHGIMDTAEAVRVLRGIQVSFPDTPLSLKISPEYSNSQVIDLLRRLMAGKSTIKAVTLFNTKPIHNSKLGNPLKTGGLSGPILFHRLQSGLEAVRKHFSASDLIVFGVGGITTGEQARYVWDRYRAIPLTLTGFLTQGPYIFHKWSQGFRPDNLRI
ncbi:MAG TPA: hypothetical protein VJ044_12240 [Candidatus Hodarchaeales archaeon]|nr:hypothetical protein [Candidatus Hodarchaeales archaeon]